MTSCQRSGVTFLRPSSIRGAERHFRARVRDVRREDCGVDAGAGRREPWDQRSRPSRLHEPHSASSFSIRVDESPVRTSSPANDQQSDVDPESSAPGIQSQLARYGLAREFGKGYAPKRIAERKGRTTVERLRRRVLARSDRSQTKLLRSRVGSIKSLPPAPRRENVTTT